jgi:hypothetical protein
MDKDLKDKWVEALRSGKYKQGREVLRNGDNEFCCLGVLADVNGQQWSETPEEYGRGTRYRLIYGGSVAIYSVAGMNWGPYASLNDTEKMTFDEIADWIEENQVVS